MSAVGRAGNQDQDPINRGIRDLLLSLTADDLKAILKTVTNSLVQYGSVPVDGQGKPLTDAKTHAINSIMLYSDPISLLNKARMKKAYLSEYLNQKGVRMTTPGTKTTLCKDLLSFWGQAIPDNLRIIDDESPRHNRPTQNPQPVQISSTSTTSSVISPVEARNGSPILTVNASSNSNQTVAQTPHHAVSSMEYEHAVSLRQQEAELGMRLAREFSSWYYERLNTLTDFTSTHFWEQCNFRLEMIFAAEPQNTVIDEIIGNGEASCAKIKDLISVKLLYFNPNSETGLRGYLNPHGLAQVMVCGTLHLRADGSHPAVGVFEQMFGLMKDPNFGNNYRIKFSVLRLREGNYLSVQSAPPELLDSSLVGIVEEVED